MKRNLVAHLTRNNQDRVFIVGVRQVGEAYHVVTRSKIRHSPTLSFEEDVRNLSLKAAMEEMRWVFQKKLAAGYEDIESEGYNGPMQLVDAESFFEYDPDSTATDGGIIPVCEEEPKSVLAICLNNLGVEHLFDYGCLYSVRCGTTKDEIITVETEDGVPVDVFRERFELREVTA